MRETAPVRVRRGGRTSAHAALRGAVFVLVGLAGYRRRGDTGSSTAIVVSIALTAIVLAFFAVDIVRNAPWTFAAIAGITALSVVLDAVFRRSGRGRPAVPASATEAT